ncbi:MAG TPA: esterase [Ochrobactrum sp.]|nr:esterase [Ochrobactrum sp.]
MIEDITIEARDDFVLSGRLFHGTGNKPLVLISSATAVPQGFYSAFAQHLIAEGARAVLTYDYRGVAASRRARKAVPTIRFKDWAKLDFPAALKRLQAAAPGHEMVGIGQSFGGQALGVSGCSGEFTRYGMVATMSGAVHLLNDKWVWPRMNIVGVPVSYLTPSMPRWMNGEPIPGSVFRDWARWCRMKNYFFDDAELGAAELTAKVKTPILSVGLEDDPWGTRRAVNHFLSYHVNAPIEQRWYSPADTGGQSIGHLGFFRSRFAQSLWPEMTEWLLDGVSPSNQDHLSKSGKPAMESSTISA